ncbi:TOBE domain-containing protein [Solidesulfovibrio sp.]
MSTAADTILDLVPRLDAATLRRLYDQAGAALARHDQTAPHRRLPSESSCQAALFTVPKDIRHLDADELDRLTRAFVAWRDAGRSPSVRRARERMRLVYTLLRLSGAKLGEVLAVNERSDIDRAGCTVRFAGSRSEDLSRKVILPRAFLDEVERFAANPLNRSLRGELFRLDPGFVRRKLYEQARRAGLPPGRVSPTALRHSRAVELLRSGVPLPVVQMLLGHSSVVLTAIYCSFSDTDCQRIVSRCVAKETRMKTSARNTFFGTVSSVRKSPLFTEISLTTATGQEVVSVITNESFDRLGLSEADPVTALVKAPWVLVGKDAFRAKTSARNSFPGTVTGIRGDGVAVEIMGQLLDGTPMCALITAESVESLDLKEGDPVWFFFKAFSVIINIP